jgi:hypothetical protein
MSRSDVSRFVTLALDDADLREQLERSPDDAFQGYDLTQNERQAIVSGDEQSLQSMGLDPMTARSWHAFQHVGEFAPDMPDARGDLPSGAP